MGEHEGRETVSIERAAELVDVSKRTLYYWIRAEKIETVETAGGVLRIYTDSLYKKTNKKLID